MGQYNVGPSTVQLKGHATPAQPGEVVEHDFSLTGPDGEHGPARETALIAAGARTPAPVAVTPGRPSVSRRADGEHKE